MLLNRGLRGVRAGHHGRMVARRKYRGMGTISTPVGNTLIFGSSVTGTPVTAGTGVGPGNRIQPVWGSNPPIGIIDQYQWSSPTYPITPTYGTTPVYSTPYQTQTTYASYGSTTQSIDPNTGIPYSTEIANAQAAASGATTTTSTDALSTTYAGLPLWMWLAIAGGGAFFLMRRR